MQIARLSSMNIKLVFAFLMLFTTVGCSSESTKSVATDASQEAIDNYNRLIEEEAAKVGKTADNKNI